MKLTVKEDAAKWYKEELSLDNDDNVRFFVRYGFGGRIPGFSLGISNESPTDTYTFTDVENITFFIENQDAWYFEETSLTVTMDNNVQEPVFEYSQTDE